MLGGVQGKPAPLRSAGRAACDPGPRLPAVTEGSYEGRALLPFKSPDPSKLVPVLVSAEPPNAAKEGNLRRRSASAALHSCSHRRVWRTAHAAKHSRLGLATPIRTLAPWPPRSKPPNRIRKSASFTAISRVPTQRPRGVGEVERVR